jgi:hypothetical protein
MVTWSQPPQREAPQAVALGSPASGGIDKRPADQEKEEGDGMMEKKTRSKASILIIIHVGNFENVPSACHGSVRCIHGSILRGYVWICGEQFKIFVDPEMYFRS